MGRLIAVYCAGLCTPFLLLLFAVLAQPVMTWIDRPTPTEAQRTADADTDQFPAVTASTSHRAPRRRA